MADTAPFVIHELEGEGRWVVLEGADLPAQGVTVAAQLRTVRTLYPGSRQASTQVMGTEEEPIEIRGQFRDVWSSRGVGGARVSMAELRSVYLGQRYCELMWGEYLVRRGYVKRVEFDLLHEAAVAYRLTFEVAEADEAEVVSEPYAHAVPEDLTVAQQAAQLAALHLDEAQAAVNEVQALL